MDVQWLDDQLYVLLDTAGSLSIVIFDSLGSAPVYQAHEIGRADGLGLYDVPSFQVQYGQIAVTTGLEFLILQQNALGEFETIYWQDIDGSSEVFANGGNLFIASGQGVDVRTTPDITATALTPSAGAQLTTSSTVLVQFNSLINTDETSLSAAVQVTDSNGLPIVDGYTVTGINTLDGGFVEILFTPEMLYAGTLTLGASAI